MNSNSLANRPFEIDDLSLRTADAAAVLEHFASGAPIDSSVIERVQTRAAQIRKDIEQARGLIDDATFQSLLDDES